MKKTGVKLIDRKMEGYYKKEEYGVPHENGQDPSSYDLILKLLRPYGTDTRIIRDENNNVIGCLSVAVPNFRAVQSKENSEPTLEGPALETQKVAEFLQIIMPLRFIQEDDWHSDSRSNDQSFSPSPFK